MSKRDIFGPDVDKEIEIGMNLAALEYDLKLCRVGSDPNFVGAEV
jgi:hypothetical protein